MTTMPFEEGLDALRAHYLERIDAAVAAGRMDLVRELADSYEDEALQLMLSVDGGPPMEPSHGPVEILELGPSRQSGSGTRRFGFWRRPKQ